MKLVKFLSNCDVVLVLVRASSNFVTALLILIKLVSTQTCSLASKSGWHTTFFTGIEGLSRSIKVLKHISKFQYFLLYNYLLWSIYGKISVKPWYGFFLVRASLKFAGALLNLIKHLNTQTQSSVSDRALPGLQPKIYKPLKPFWLLS